MITVGIGRMVPNGRVTRVSPNRVVGLVDHRVSIEVNAKRRGTRCHQQLVCAWPTETTTGLEAASNPGQLRLAADDLMRGFTDPR